jgi:hypothetical protein
MSISEKLIANGKISPKQNEYLKKGLTRYQKNRCPNYDKDNIAQLIDNVTRQN